MAKPTGATWQRVLRSLPTGDARMLGASALPCVSRKGRNLPKRLRPGSLSSFGCFWTVRARGKSKGTALRVRRVLVYFNHPAPGPGSNPLCLDTRAKLSRAQQAEVAASAPGPASGVPAQTWNAHLKIRTAPMPAVPTARPELLELGTKRGRGRRKAVDYIRNTMSLWLTPTLRDRLVAALQ